MLKSQREATDIALALNATVDMFSGATARWAAADLLKERGEVVLSPADRVRWRSKSTHAFRVARKRVGTGVGSVQTRAPAEARRRALNERIRVAVQKHPVLQLGNVPHRR